jgi:hypothetical protein
MAINFFLVYSVGFPNPRTGKIARHHYHHALKTKIYSNL